jgi:hypothetical protein
MTQPFRIKNDLEATDDFICNSPLIVGPDFDPVLLFANGEVGHWPDGYAPADGRVFQVSDGTSPATAAAQPVGRANALAGGNDAQQATSLSRPTLSRVPRGGQRSFANGSAAPQNNTFWASTISSNGITATRVATGDDQNGPWAEYAVSGTSTATSIIDIYLSSASSLPAGLGDIFTAGCRFEYTAGSLPPQINSGVRVGVRGQENSIFREEALSLFRATVPALVSSTLTVSNASVNRARAVVQVFTVNGVTVNYTIRVQALQFEIGLDRTAFQHVLTARDVTEAGVPDVWHLNDDGNDSLPVTLPAGDYTAAWVDRLGAVNIASGLSVTTTLDTLRGQNQADVLIINRALAAGEQAALTAYWQARYLP